MLYAAMGISLGTLAGTVVALNTGPNASPQALMADISSAASSVIGESHVKADSYPAFAPSQGPAARVQRVAVTNEAENEGGPSAARPAAESAPATHSAAKAGSATAVQSVPSKTPATEKSAQPRVVPEEVRPTQPAAHPVTRPARTLLASAPSMHPATNAAKNLLVLASVSRPAAKHAHAELVKALAGDSGQQAMPQLDFGSEPAPAVFYSEGDLTVADYDAASGTIESSDGRTFVVGPTVAVNNATSWDEYRADVHYRCNQSGSCTLIRPGVVASSARLI